MAIVSLLSKGLAANLKETVKTSLTHKFLDRVGSRDDEENSDGKPKKNEDIESGKGGVATEIRPVTSPAGTVVAEHKGRRFLVGIEGREQAMPADAVLTTEDAENVSWPDMGFSGG